LESFASSDGVTAIVDYAHTPDALENVLHTLRGLAPTRLIAIVGCGGDRDRTKRPVMAATACELADQVVFTADNPRSEEIADIFQDMRAGVPAESRASWVEDRRQAIVATIQQARKGDLICVAGKGHETTQEIRGVRLPFDDRDVVREALQGRAA
jgi:UDP-N-acetylmuramoyl-L-alanyl-D-glutamate--2,6-diaminopimelate ligase